MRRKILTMMLVIVLAVSMIPTMAFARGCYHDIHAKEYKGWIYTWCTKCDLYTKEAVDRCEHEHAKVEKSNHKGFHTWYCSACDKNLGESPCKFVKGKCEYCGARHPWVFLCGHKSQSAWSTGNYGFHTLFCDKCLKEMGEEPCEYVNGQCISCGANKLMKMDDPTLEIIHFTFKNGEDVLSAGDLFAGQKIPFMPTVDAEGFVGWKLMMGNVALYEDEYTFEAFAALIGDNFTADGEAWIHFEAVIEEAEAPASKSIHISYVDAGANSVGTEELEVPAGATTFNSNDLKAVPAGYELVLAGDYYFGEGNRCNVEVRAVETEPEIVSIGINYYDIGAKKTAAEVVLNVYPEEETIGGDEIVANLPAGYELAGEKQTAYTINGGYVYVEVKAAAADPITVPIDVYVNNNCEVTFDLVLEDGDTVCLDEAYAATYLEDGMTFVRWENNSGKTVTGNSLSNNEWLRKQKNYSLNLYATEEVEPATKQVYVQFTVDGEWHSNAGNTIIVEADATSVNTSLAADQIPEGYELALLGDVTLGGEYGDTIQVPIQAVAPATKQIYINYVDNTDNFIASAGKTISVSADETTVDVALTADQVPEGWELAEQEAAVIGGEYDDTIEVVIIKKACEHNMKSHHEASMDAAGNFEHNIVCDECGEVIKTEACDFSIGNECFCGNVQKAFS